MYEIPPTLKSLLEKLGVNTTRLQWKLYELERRRNAPDEDKRRETPAALRWLKYRHKFCPNCNALADRNEKVCPSCGADLPSMALYRVMRAVGLVVPAGSAFVTFGFILFMLGLFLLSILLTGPGSIMNPNMETLWRFGMQPNAPFLDATGEYWRILSFGLFHAGLIHIGFNTIALAQVGPMLEAEIGPRRMFVLITIAQIASGLAVYFFHSVGAVGASGWLFGLLGFGVAWFHRQGAVGRNVRNFFIQWSIYGLLFGLMFGFNNTAHMGGLAAGAALGLTADLTAARRTAWTGIWEWLVVPCAALWLVALFFLGRSILMGG